MKKNRKLSASQRKLKNARQRMKYRLEKQGFDKKTIRTLLDSFRDEFIDKSGRVNVGGRKKSDIDKKIMEHVKSRFKITGEDFVNLLRNNYSHLIDTQNSNGPLIAAFGVEIFSEYWDAELDMDKLADFNNLIPDKELVEYLGDSINMIIKNKLG